MTALCHRISSCNLCAIMDQILCAVDADVAIDTAMVVMPICELTAVVSVCMLITTAIAAVLVG
jgi:hypothetical protein